jgi:hypothetical protein
MDNVEIAVYSLGNRFLNADQISNGSEKLNATTGAADSPVKNVSFPWYFTFLINIFVIVILAELLYVGYLFSQKVYKRARKLPKVKAFYQKVEMQVTYHEMSGLSYMSRNQSMATQPDEV